jgi:glyoxylase-like metal-dependent hydrolase (beta-lactamase superfamily II)
MFCLSQKPRAEMSHAVLPSSAWSGYFALTPTGVVSDSTFQLNQRSFGDDPSARPKPISLRCASQMTKAKALIVPVTPFQQNCTLLWCEATKRAVVIDPGGDLPDIERAITQANVAVDKIWLTRGHVDHVAGAAELKARLNVPIEGPHRDDLFLLQHVVESARNFGMQDAADVTPDRWLEEGDEVEVGELRFAVRHCPGHSPGSIVFLNAAQRLAIVGDVLFAGSIGRTDLPGGDHRQLLKSISDKLLPLADNVAVVSGHGPATTIGRERASNPFLQQAAAGFS